jgi:hypothetical protein
MNKREAELTKPFDQESFQRFAEGVLERRRADIAANPDRYNQDGTLRQVEAPKLPIPAAPAAAPDFWTAG